MFEVRKETVVIRAHQELEQLRDCPKNQGEELIEVNTREEGKEPQHIFIVLACLFN